jgi:hypothetical protein
MAHEGYGCQRDELNQRVEMRQAGTGVGSHTITHRTSPTSGPKRSGPSSETPIAPQGIRSVRRSTPSRMLSASADGTSLVSRSRRHAIPDTRPEPRSCKSEIVGNHDVIGRWQEYRARGAFPAQDDGGTEDRVRIGCVPSRAASSVRLDGCRRVRDCRR